MTLQNDSVSTGLYHCGVTLMGQHPPAGGCSHFRAFLPATGNHFHNQGSEKKLQLPKMQEVSLAFSKGRGNFVWGRTGAGLPNVCGFRHVAFTSTTVGTGNAVGILDGNLCKVGLSLASRCHQTRRYSGRSR